MRPSASVRRMHNTPIGPTGAAIANPMIMPSRNKPMFTNPSEPLHRGGYKIQYPIGEQRGRRRSSGAVETGAEKRRAPRSAGGRLDPGSNGHSWVHSTACVQGQASRGSLQTALECGFGVGDGHLHLGFVDDHDHIPVLVVAEYPGPRSLEPVEGLRGGMPVGVIRAALYDGVLYTMHKHILFRLFIPQGLGRSEAVGYPHVEVAFLIPTGR